MVHILRTRIGMESANGERAVQKLLNLLDGIELGYVNIDHHAWMIDPKIPISASHAVGNTLDFQPHRLSKYFPIVI